MMKISPELAEACGIHAGDGYLRDDGKRRELDISGSIEEKEYYDEHVVPLFEKLFNIKIKPRIFPSRNTYGFVIRDKRIIKFFHELGFPYGAKSTIVKIPNVILKSKDKMLYSKFLRGLFDTDGNINFRRSYGLKYSVFKKEHHHYPRIDISVVSKYLVTDLIFLLKELGFRFYYHIYNPKKINEKEKHRIEINGSEQINKWVRIISMKNNVKFSRYLIWKKFGFCRPHTDLEQRKAILRKK